ncbi:MAG: serine/threonine protein kinase [Kofleriaceae bacterium]|nr:serine/threonine protein kinase [Kofleriaceae bacterium]
MTGSHDDLDSLADELGSMAELLRGVAAAPLRDPDLAARFAALAALPVQLGDYRLDAEVGGGGMGRVFRGRDLRLGRDVAIKVLRVGQHGDVAALGDALAREARGTAALDHPRIVAIYDAGLIGGLPVLVLAWLDGEPVARRLRRGPMRRREVARMADDVLDGLAHAHARGLVHCDVKPENLLRTRDGDTMLLDFGLSSASSGGAAAADASSGLAGTPAYMAPERWRGEPPTAPADVWAFALVLIEALTASAGRVATAPGSPGSPACETVTASATTMLSRAGSAPAARALGPAARLAQLRRRAPALADALARALDPDPDRRPTAAELRATLRPLLAPRRTRRRTIAATAVAALALAGAAWWRQPPAAAPPPPPSTS